MTRAGAFDATESCFDSPVRDAAYVPVSADLYLSTVSNSWVSSSSFSITFVFDVAFHLLVVKLISFTAWCRLGSVVSRCAVFVFVR